jgi:hypothetical protein
MADTFVGRGVYEYINMCVCITYIHTEREREREGRRYGS